MEHECSSVGARVRAPLAPRGALFSSVSKSAGNPHPAISQRKYPRDDFSVARGSATPRALHHCAVLVIVLVLVLVPVRAGGSVFSRFSVSLCLCGLSSWVRYPLKHAELLHVRRPCALRGDGADQPQAARPLHEVVRGDDGEGRPRRAHQEAHRPRRGLRHPGALLHRLLRLGLRGGGDLAGRDDGSGQRGGGDPRRRGDRALGAGAERRRPQGMTRRLIVIGAGPVGLEAALADVARGYDVTVLEKDEVGANLRRWGATRLFSPVRMNMSAAARRILGDACPPEDALLTGPEMADLILEPLAASAPLQGRVRIGHRVTAVGRARLTRRDLPGHPLRGERPFRLLVEGPAGEEVLVAEYVLDASGVYGQPAALGAGGIPAPGERGLNGQLIRDLGRLDERLRD